MANFEVNNVSINTLLSYVKDGVIAIPEIQRPFVWDTVKVRDLIDSLYKGYPVGYIITWKSPDVRLKDGTKSEGRQILIDGQQRITALTAALLGQKVLMSNYRRRQIKISFNVKTEEFETYNPTIDHQPEWISDIASIIYDNDINMYQLVSEYADKLNVDPNDISKKFLRLQKIKDIPIGRIELGSSLDIDTVTEIFIRINSKGVVLSQADFAMSKISVDENNGGNIVRKTIDYFCHLSETPSDYDSIVKNDTKFSATDQFRRLAWIKNNNQKIYLPDYTDVLRVAFTYKFRRGKLQDLVSMLSGRDFETREYRYDVVENSYKLLRDGVDRFVNQTNFERYLMILESAGIREAGLVRSSNVKNFGYILYLLLTEKGVAPEVVEHLVRKWVIMSILTQRYTSSPESAFDYDIRMLCKSDDIVGAIESVIADRTNETFWTVTLVNSLNTPVTSSPYWKTFVIAQIKMNARGFLSKDITVRSLIDNRGDIHHIFPKNYLRKNGYENRADYNQIANFAMLQTEVNIQVSDRPPFEYMSLIQNQCIDGYNGKHIGGIVDLDDLKSNMSENCIPESFVSMDVSNYQEFLRQRRILMADYIRRYFESL